MVQSLVVAVLVVACTLRAAWILAPAGVRRRIAAAALSLPLPARVATTMRRHAARGAGCACDGCGNAGSPGAPQVRSAGVTPITLHRRSPP